MSGIGTGARFINRWNQPLEPPMRLMKGRTTFVIAHRLATVTHADSIIVLKNGKIIESGVHAQLMRSGGHYSALVQRQTRGLILNEGE